MESRRLSTEAVALRKQAEMSHAASIALMKWLSEVAQRMGVARHVYVVGGAVRNFLIDKPIKDIDMVVDSLALKGGKDAAWVADSIARAVPARTKVVTDSLMVSKVFIEGPWELEGHQMEGEVIEIVNAREEVYEVDPETGDFVGHKPIEVKPTSLEIDVTRREFTFNTLMWSLMSLAKGPDKAEIIDLTGCGIKDLYNREMRCPQDPDETFKQDPTRIIRTIKFAFKYGFKLPPDVKAAAKRQAKGLKRIVSKTQGVLQKVVLDNPQYKKALDVMDDLGVNEVLKEMMQENKSFRSFMVSHAGKKGVEYMFDLMDVGLPVGSPISFLSAKQQRRFREITTPMERGDAQAFLDMLQQPGQGYKDPSFVNNLAEQYGYARREMRDFMPVVDGLTRELLLENPALGGSPAALRRLVEQQLPRRLPRRTASTALSYGSPSEEDLLKMQMPTPIFPMELEDFDLEPPPGAEETLEELQALRQVAAEERPEAEAFVRESDGEILPLFAGLWNRFGVRVDQRWAREMVRQAKANILRLKWHFNRARPHQVGEAIGQPFVPMDSQTAHTPAYPSGHAIQAYLLGEFSSRLDPDHTDEYFDLVDRILWGRVQGGYHWPSDISYGVDVAQEMAEVMELPPQFSPRVARIMECRARHMRQQVRWAKTYTVNKGDLVWYGKYKNQRGVVQNFGMSDKGDPTITVEQLPAPSARKPKKKSPKELNLFKIRPREEDGKDEAQEKKAARRVVAKFKAKKKVPKTDGSGTTTIYEYGPRQVAQRHKDKAKRLKALKSSLSDLRAKVSGDMASKDPETRLTALAVALLDKTYERVGNEKSADERGHHGITTLCVEHLTLKGKKATFTYVGKSGVKQKKVVDDPQIIQVLKHAVEGKSPSERILCDGEDCLIRARHVNSYLKPFDITAKDLRGLHANEEMRVHLQDIRKKGENLPHPRKERDKILKAEFKDALALVAEVVGHQASTLRSQYLVPGLEKAYMKDGTVIEDLAKQAALERDAGLRQWLMGLLGKSTIVKAIFDWGEQQVEGPSDFPKGMVPEGYIWQIGDSWYSTLGEGFRVRKYRRERDAVRGIRFARVAFLLQAKQATKSTGEQEDEEAKRLVRNSPKKKPPRVDLERRRVLDEDIEQDPDQDQEKKDTSHNFKDVAAAMAARRVAFRYRQAEEFTEQEWKTYKEKHPGASKDDHEIRSIGGEGEEEAKDTWAELSDDEKMEAIEEGAKDEFAKIKDEFPDATLTENEVTDMFLEQGANDQDPFSPASVKERRDKVLGEAEMDSATNNLVLLTQSFGGKESKKVEEALSGLEGDDRATFLDSYQKVQETSKNRDSETRKNPKARKELLDLIENLDAVMEALASANPQTIGEVLALFEYATKVLFNPALLDPSNPVSEEGAAATGEALTQARERSGVHAATAFGRYKEATPEERAHAKEALAMQMEDLPEDSPKSIELQGVISGLLAASALHDGEEATGVGPTMQLLVKALDAAGEVGVGGALFAPVGQDMSTPEVQDNIRNALSGVLDSDWESLVDKDDPIYPIAELLSDDDAGMGMEDRQFLRTVIADYLTDEITVVEESARADHAKEEPTSGDVKKDLMERRKKDKSRINSGLSEAKAGLDQSVIDEAEGKTEGESEAEAEGSPQAEAKKGFFAALLDLLFPDSRAKKWQEVLDKEDSPSTDKKALAHYDLNPWDTSKLPAGHHVPLDAR